jgi:uncharacterized protein
MVTMRARGYYEAVWRDFDAQKRLVLVSGPRQAGKTTLAKAVAGKEPASVYLNYDIPRDKRRLLDNPAFFEELDHEKGVVPLVILDEIHKYRDWKNYLKGAYDGYGDRFRFLVTGSGRLDLYQRKGDSLAGRYWQFHLFPFTLGELCGLRPDPEAFVARMLDLPHGPGRDVDDLWEALSRCSGFPEPFVSGQARTYRRWAASYHRQVLREDVRDAFAVKDIDTMETLYGLLPERVGSGFSASSCADILKVSHGTIAAWIEVFKRFALIFSLRPYHRKIGRSLVKEPKLYFYDFARVEDPGARFENMVALELQRAAVLWTDYGAGDFDLWYLRTKDRKEVDFLLTRDQKPLLMVEAKLSDTDASPTLAYFQALLGVPAVQLVNRPGIGRIITAGVRPTLVVTASRWLATLG